MRLAPRVSRRNYVAIGLRGPLLIGTRPDGRGCFSWQPDGAAGVPVEDYLVRAVEQTRRHYHVHSERIFLAGVCEGATLAYRFALSFPEKVAGVIALNGMLPRGGPLFRSQMLDDVLHRIQEVQRRAVVRAIVPDNLLLAGCLP